MIHFVVHDENDSVGVVVVEGVKAGQDLTGWIMDQDKDLRVKAVSDIPIGHKLAIKSLGKDATGAGLGLSLVRQIARLHGGAAVVAPPGAAPSCFRVSLPAAKA